MGDSAEKPETIAEQAARLAADPVDRDEMRQVMRDVDELRGGTETDSRRDADVDATERSDPSV
ncbi:hypothetical protein ACPPVQ_05940 [Diaminobutyricibacter sp. McL0618]|uniref:hypothetical protein n=1 Tax=Leifsonia sp. McL0618 TaxID=3415677 RepID=UPI003CE9BF14